MTSSLRLITYKFVTRSVLPALVSSSRFIVAGYSTMPKHELFDQSWIRNMVPTITSTSFNMEMHANERSLKVYICRSNERTCVSLDHVENDDIHDTLLVQGKTHKECCLTGINLQHTTIKEEEMKDGTLLTVTHPTEDDILASISANILNSFNDIGATRNWAYYGN
ncbi:hypothetical protein QVD17_31168 [Tagetes erecta]|uniref:Uncharacterized protein n=1 Tax=Tagetes erecta TaxID=13708 RepID=A0AAD8K382_TARER|nr:hypothetical protein QVD17_31168 [Tagetes erecta]